MTDMIRAHLFVFCFFSRSTVQYGRQRRGAVAVRQQCGPCMDGRIALKESDWMVGGRDGIVGPVTRGLAGTLGEVCITI